MSRSTVIRFLAVVVLLAAIVNILSALRGDASAGQLVLAEVHGVVGLIGPEGDRRARAGAVLEAQDRITTGPDARAVLSMNDSRIRLGPSSSVEVRGVSEDGVRLELENGVLEATVRPSGAVRVANRGQQVVSTGGEFRMGFDGEVLEVNAIEGEVGLQGFPEAARLAQGEAVRVSAGGHAEIGPISDDLLLEVSWPTPGNKKTVWVQGRTEPGMRVKVRNHRGELASERANGAGVFRIRVDLDEGEQEYTVVAVNPLGKEERVSELIKLDTTGPSFRGGAEYRR